MEALLWLDVPLLVFGIGAVFTAGWLKFGSNRAGSPRRRLQPLTVVLVVGGLASLSAAGLDHALAVWDRSQRPLAVEPDPLFEAGTLAPDFALPSLERRSYRLSDFRGRKPVLLTLSSFGWDVFCSQVVHLRQLHETYGDQVQFLFVNIWDPGHKLPDEVQQVLSDTQIPLDLQREPSHCARAGKAGFHLNFPCLLDTEDYEVMKLYRAFPQRMLLLDAAGRIVVDSGLGPWQPFLWQQISDWLKSHPVP